MNAATRLNDVIVEHWSAGRNPTEFYADGFRREDRRTLIAMPDANRAAQGEAISDLHELGGRVLPHRPVAVRGDRFSLAEVTIEYEDGRSVVQFLIVNMLDESLEQIELSVLLDDDDYELAYQTLDSLWLSSLPTDAAAGIRSSLQGP